MYPVRGPLMKKLAILLVTALVAGSVYADGEEKTSFLPQVKAFIQAVNLKKDATVNFIKEYAQTAQQYAQKTVVKVKPVAQDVATIAQAKATKAKVAAECVMNNPQVALVAAKNFVLAHKKQVAGSALVALVAYKAARTCGPLAAKKRDGCFKSFAKTTAAGVIAAVCAVLTFDKFAGLTLPAFINA